jgi:hypothetical protein
MSDWEAMRIHVYRDPQVAERVLRRYETYGVTAAMTRRQDSASSMTAGTVDDPYVTGRASEVYYQAVTRLRITLDVFERALNGLTGAKGRKSVILVSEGFIHDINVDEFKRVNEASALERRHLLLNARGLEECRSHDGRVGRPPRRGLRLAETLDAVAGADAVRTTAAASPSATRTTSRGGSRGSPTRPRCTTCSATSPRTPPGTASSGRSRSSSRARRAGRSGRARATTP